MQFIMIRKHGFLFIIPLLLHAISYAFMLMSYKVTGLKDMNLLLVSDTPLDWGEGSVWVTLAGALRGSLEVRNFWLFRPFLGTAHIYFNICLILSDNTII